MLVLLSMFFPAVLFPAHGAGDIRPLDLYFSYSPGQAYEYLVALGVEGRSAYIGMALTSDLVFPVDSVLLSIGTRPNTLLKQTTPGRHQRIYAGGDAVTGGATVIQAAGAGTRAAAAIL